MGSGVVIESVEGHHGFMITSVIVAGGNVGDARLYQDGKPLLRVRTNDFLNFKSGIPLAVGATITVLQSGTYGATISGYVY